MILWGIKFLEAFLWTFPHFLLPNHHSSDIFVVSCDAFLHYTLATTLSYSKCDPNTKKHTTTTSNLQSSFTNLQLEAKAMNSNDRKQSKERNNQSFHGNGTKDVKVSLTYLMLNVSWGTDQFANGIAQLLLSHHRSMRASVDADVWVSLLQSYQTLFNALLKW